MDIILILLESDKMKKLKEYLPYLAGILVSTIFGFSFMFTKNSLEIMSPLQILAYRFTVAAVLLSILKITGIIKINLKGKRAGSLLILALVQPITYFIFETVGVKLTSSSEAGMMIALIPVAVTIFASIFLKEKPNYMQIIFIITSVAGVLFIIIAKGISNVNPSYVGLLALMGAVLSAGVYNILSRKLSVRFNPVEITYVMMWAGAVVFNGLALIQGALNGSAVSHFTPLLNISSWLPVLYLGVLSSVVAFFMMNFMLSRIPASQSSVFSNLTTVVSILAGVLIKGEPFYWFHVAGGAMILLGVWGTNYFTSKNCGISPDGESYYGIKAEKF